MSYEFSLIESSPGGVLTKTVYTHPDTNELVVKGATQLLSGTVNRAAIESPDQLPSFAKFCKNLPYGSAVTLGNVGHPKVPLVTKKHYVQGTNVARTKDCFSMGRKGLVLLDIDYCDYEPEALHGMLVHIIPELANIGFIMWPSTSSYIYNSTTGECLRGRHGYHAYIAVDNMRGAHSLGVIRDYIEYRMWTAGYGWIEVSAAGSALKRTIIDLAVFSPERLIYEAPVILGPNLYQQKTAEPFYRSGTALDAGLVPAIGPSEKRVLYNHIRDAMMKPEVKESITRIKNLRKETFIREHGDVDRNRAAAVFDRLMDVGNLLGPMRIYPHTDSLRSEDIPSLNLSTDETGRKYLFVSQILEDPDKYANIPCCDPMEPEYQNWGQKAIIILDDRGKNPFISSFAHGKRTYKLKWDTESLINAIYSIEAAGMSNASLTQAWQRLVRNFDGEEEDYHTIADALKNYLGVKATKSKLMNLSDDKKDEEMTPSVIAENLFAKYGDSLVFLDDEIIPTYLFYHSTGADAGIWTPIPRPRFEKWVQDDIHEMKGISFTDRHVVETQKILTRKVTMSSDEFSCTAGVSRDLVMFNNGVYDLKTECFSRGHSRDHKARWKLPYDWEEGSACPKFLTLLNGMFDTEGLDIFRAALRGALTNRADLQYYLEMYGASGAGKSTAIDIMTYIIGERNTVSSQLKILETDKFEIASLISAKLVVFPDEAQYHEKVDVFKSLVGHDRQRLARKNIQRESRDNRRFSGVAVVTANEPLYCPDKSGAIERRRRALMCHKLWKGKPVPGLAESIFKQEGSQIFNWLMAMPEGQMITVLGSKQDCHSMAHYRESIPIFMFLEDSLTASGEGCVPIGSNFGTMDKTLFSECRAYNEGNEGRVRAFQNPKSFRSMLDQALPILFPEARVRRVGSARKAYVQGLAWKADLETLLS